MPVRLFVSHAREDRDIAAALKTLIAGVFTSAATAAVEVVYSSDDGSGGLEAGDHWLDWILTAVTETDVCVVLLTPLSVSEPWLTWEAGAVTGVVTSMASASLGGRKERSGGRIVPLLFGIEPEYIPAPLRHLHAVTGGDSAQVLKWLVSLHKLTNSSQRLSDRSAKPRIGRFIRETQETLLRREREQFNVGGSAHKPRLVYFVNRQWGSTLEPLEGEIATGVRLRVRRFSGELSQRWQLHEVSAGMYRIATVDGDKCLSVQNDSDKHGASIILWDYEKHASQHWKIVRHSESPDLASTVQIVNVATGFRLMPDPDDRYIVQSRPENVRDQDWWVVLPPDISGF